MIWTDVLTRGWLLDDIGDVSDGQNDTPNSQQFRLWFDMSRYLKSAVNDTEPLVSSIYLTNIFYFQDHKYDECEYFH